MEMDLVTTIIGIVAIIICALPFVMMSKNRKKKAQAQLHALSEIATQNNCKITQHEIFDSSAIGLDEINNFVFFYRQIKDKEIRQLVDLSEIHSCKIINTNRVVKYNGISQKVIDKLELSFLPYLKNKQEVKMEFFNTDLSLQLNGEHQIIEKWSKLIDDRLKQRV